MAGLHCLEELDDSIGLRADRDGALLSRGLVRTDLVHDLAQRVRSAVRSLGWVDVAGTALVQTPDYDDPGFVALQQRVAAFPALDRVRRCPEVLELMATLIGGAFEAQRGDVIRFQAPGASYTPAHQDGNYIREADSLWTLWLPLHDCPLERGPLALWLGSHRRGAIEHVEDGVCGRVDAPDAVWSSTSLQVGDAIVFQSLLVHRSLPNLSEEPRLSVDLRYAPGPARGS